MGEIEALREDLRRRLACYESEDFPGFRLPKAVVDGIVELSAPTLDLIELSEDSPCEEVLPRGATKRGGWPDLPSDLEWPSRPALPNAIEKMEKIRRQIDEHRGSVIASVHRDELKVWVEYLSRPRPLWFIAQYNFGELNSDGWLGSAFPSSGRLLLFYEADLQPWGYEPHHAFSHVAVWDETPVETLAPRQPPPELAINKWDYPIAKEGDAKRLSFSKGLSIPSGDAPEALALLGPPKKLPQEWLASWIELARGREASNFAVYTDFLFAGGRERDRIGGWPFPVQGEMRGECAEMSDFENRPEDWQFLFQEQEEDGWGWGAADGLIYLWIHSDDFRVRRFDRTQLILQTT